MSDTTNTAASGAGEALPAASTPKSDAEAALQTQQTPEQPTEPNAEQKAAEAAEAQRKEQEARNKNRTKEYIERLRNEAAQARREADEVRRELARHQGQSPTQHQPASRDSGPDISQFNNFAEYQQARDAWVLAQAQRQLSEQLEQRAQRERQDALISTYQQRADDFAATHDDFDVVVGSMPILPEHLQYAIGAHPQGPAILYHLGNNRSDLAQIAALPPHFAEWGIADVAARLSAAPAAVQHITAPPVPAPKPVTQAPPPPPMVGGRSPTETPATKLTDDEWYAKDRERRRKR